MTTQPTSGRQFFQKAGRHVHSRESKKYWQESNLGPGSQALICSFLLQHSSGGYFLRMLRERYRFERYYYWKRARGLARTWQRLNRCPVETPMPLRGSLRSTTTILVSAGLTWIACPQAKADEPKPKPENTISIQLGEPVAPQKFEHSLKFWIVDVTDRSGNPQPMMVMKERGGVFLDKQPTAIVKEAIEHSLKAANLLAPDAASADLLLRVYLFHFGLAAGSGLDLFGKVEFSTMVKNTKTGESQEVKAAGTSIAKGAVRKKNMQKNVEEDIEEALHDATRNFVRGTPLKEAVAALSKGTEVVPAAAPSVTETPKPVSR